MSEFKVHLVAAIEKGAEWQDHHQFRTEPYKEITHADSFKAGANLLKPLLMKAIEQRNLVYKSLEPICGPQNEFILEDEKELLKMMGDL